MRKTPTNQEPPELTTGDIARELGITQPTVRVLIKRGQLRAWRFGRNYRTSRAAVREFLSRSATQQ